MCQTFANVASTHSVRIERMQLQLIVLLLLLFVFCLVKQSGFIINITERLFDDGVAELAECSCRRVTLHADAVSETTIKVCQNGVPDARTKHHLTLVVDLLVVERTVVDVEAFYCPLVCVRLLHARSK